MQIDMFGGREVQSTDPPEQCLAHNRQLKNIAGAGRKEIPQILKGICDPKKVKNYYLRINTPLNTLEWKNKLSIICGEIM